MCVHARDENDFKEVSGVAGTIFAYRWGNVVEIPTDARTFVAPSWSDDYVVLRVKTPDKKWRPDIAVTLEMAAKWPRVEPTGYTDAPDTEPTVNKRSFQPVYVGGMSFGTAMAYLKEGRKVARLGWNGKNMWLELQVPDENSKMTLPYIFMTTADKHRVPWLASQSDMLAEDWTTV